jgi:hypothetical protein
MKSSIAVIDFHLLKEQQIVHSSLGLGHVISSTGRTLGLWVRIQLETRTFVLVFL